MKMTEKNIKENILKGGKLAIERLLERKRRDNLYIVISENGKILKLNATSIKK